MAEDTNVTEQTGATAQQTSESGDHFSELSLDELADAVSQRVFRADQSQADKAVAAFRKEILPFLEEGKQTTALVRALARGDVLTEEQLEGMDRARAEAARVQQLEHEVAQLRIEKTNLEKGGLNEQQIDSVLTTSAANHLVEFARDQGFIAERDDDRAWDALRATGVLPKERIASKGDDYGTLRYEREGKQAIRKAVDAKAHESEPPPQVPPARGAAPTQQDLPAYELIKRGMAARQATNAVPR